MGRGHGGFGSMGIREEREMPERGFHDDGMRQRGGFERGGFNPGKKISLNRVTWYLAIFASFTVIVIYLDNGIHYLKKRSDNRPGSIPDDNICPEVRE